MGLSILGREHLIFLYHCALEPDCTGPLPPLRGVFEGRVLPRDRQRSKAHRLLIGISLPFSPSWP